MLVTLKLKRGMKPTEEQLAEIYANAPKSDEEIDYSDIPPSTPEQLERMKENRRRRKNLKFAS